MHKLSSAASAPLDFYNQGTSMCLMKKYGVPCCCIVSHGRRCTLAGIWAAGLLVPAAAFACLLTPAAASLAAGFAGAVAAAATVAAAGFGLVTLAATSSAGLIDVAATAAGLRCTVGCLCTGRLLSVAADLIAGQVRLAHTKPICDMYLQKRTYTQRQHASIEQSSVIPFPQCCLRVLERKPAARALLLATCYC